MRPCIYLMSRFFLITAQTKEFPAMLVMISINVTTFTAVSVDSHMTLSVLAAITEIRRNMYFAKDIPITLFHKKNVQWQLPSPFSELGNQRCCSSKKFKLKFLVFDLVQTFRSVVLCLVTLLVILPLQKQLSCT